MNIKNTSALIISADTRLKRILLNKTSKNDSFELSLENNIASLSSLPKSDAYIYDVELADNDLVSTIAAILDLKRIISKKPLLLIGREQALNKVLSNNKIESMVAKTINKPISYGQLQLAINSCLLNPTLLQHQKQHKNSSNQSRIVVLSLSFVFILVSAITYLKTDDSPFEQTAHSLDVSDATQNLTIPSRNFIEPDAQLVEQLNQFATLALDDGRLSEPENSNAILYLKQIREIAPYNTNANLIHNKLFELLEAAYITHSSEGDDDQTKKALVTILEIEPYNYKYARLLAELKERTYLAKESNARDNIQETEVSNYNKDIAIATDKVSKASNDTLETEVSNFEGNITITTHIDAPKNIERSQSTQKKTAEKPISAADNLVASVDKEIEIIPQMTIKPAHILQRAEPYYPKLAVDLNYEGWIELEYQVDVEGHATNIKILDGQKIRTFEKAAVQAIKKWIFSPSVDTASNKPRLSERMTTKFNFSLD